MYEALGATAGSRRRSPEGFSRLRDSLSQGQYEILVMDRLGPSIIDLTKYMREEPFTVGTVCMIGRQAIRRIRTLHNKGILHMDIKPHNMLMGTGKNGNTLYVTDFGTSHRHDERRTFLHRSRHPEQYELGPNDNNPNVNTWRVPSPFLGTDWFASLNVHRLRGMMSILQPPPLPALRLAILKNFTSDKEPTDASTVV